MTAQKATLTGLLAILLWSTMIGLVRKISLNLGPVGGPAMMYTLSAGLLLLVAGWPALRTFPRRYLFLGGFLFAVTEITLSLAIGYAHNSRQTLEIGMVNYLWPSLTVLFTVIFNKQKASWLLIPGIATAFTGICLVLAGKGGLNPAEILRNIQDNPLSYGLAFITAFAWASYCIVTSKFAGGKNGITLFFTVTAVLLWGKFFSSPQPAMIFNGQVILCLLLAAAATSLGYAAWNTGILYGNVTVLATASYFTPVLSSLFSAFVLGSALHFSFWKGVMLVCAGSFLCWLSTRKSYKSG